MTKPQINILRFLAQHGPYPMLPSWGTAWNQYRVLHECGLIAAAPHEGGLAQSRLYEITPSGNRALVASCFKGAA